MRYSLTACLFAFATPALAADPQLAVNVGDGKAYSVAVAAAPDGGALVGIDMTAGPVPERRENAGVDLKSGQHAAAVAAYNVKGGLRWSRAITSTRDEPKLRAIASAGDGSSCAVGRYAGTANVIGSSLPALQAGSMGNAFALSLAADGTPRWFSSFGGTAGTSANAVEPAPEGGWYVAGSFRESGDFGGKQVQSAGGTDAYVLRLDSAGKIVWLRTFGGVGNEEVVGLALVPAGGVYALMRYTDSMHIDVAGAPRDIANAGADDALVLQLDAAGAVQAAQSISSDKPDHYVALAANGDGVAVIGYYSGAENLKVGEQSLALHSQGGSQALVLHLDPALRLVDYANLGGGGVLLLQAATYAPDGRLWTAGSITGNVKIGDTTLQADGTDGVLLAFDKNLQSTPRAYRYGGPRGQNLFRVAVSGDSVYVSGVTSSVKKSEAEREREEAQEREERARHPPKPGMDKAAAERARAAEEAEREREQARSRSQAVLLRYKLH